MEIAAITGHAVGDVRSIMDKCYLNRDPAMAVRAIQKLEKGTKSANRAANQSLPVIASERVIAKSLISMVGAQGLEPWTR